MTYTLKDGSITIAIDGREIVLKVTVEAAVNISKKFGGIFQAAQKVAAMDYEAMFNLLEIGKGSPLTALETNSLFAQGANTLVDYCYNYIEMLQNGGKSPESEKKEVEKPIKGKS